MEVFSFLVVMKVCLLEVGKVQEFVVLFEYLVIYVCSDMSTFNGVLVVEIIEGKELTGANTSCQVTVGARNPGSEWKPLKEFTTQTVAHTQDPIWAEEFAVKLTSPEARLVITVQEQKRKNNVALGEADTVVSLNQKWGEKTTFQLTQNGKAVGSVALILHYYAGEDEAPKVHSFISPIHLTLFCFREKTQQNSEKKFGHCAGNKKNSTNLGKQSTKHWKGSMLGCMFFPLVFCFNLPLLASNNLTKLFTELDSLKANLQQCKQFTSNN
jgi:hypothetical protein